jgi:hypothetical protein
MRPTILLLATGLLAASASLAPAASRRGSGLTITRQSARPTRFAGNGGAVALTVKVSWPGAAINEVSAHVLLEGTGIGSETILHRSGGSSYSGSVAVPMNRETRKAHGTITVAVTARKGNAVVVDQRNVGTITVGPGNDSLPPPPPP